MRAASYSELFSKIKERLDHNDFALEDDSKSLSTNISPIMMIRTAIGSMI